VAEDLKELAEKCGAKETLFSVKGLQFEREFKMFKIIKRSADSTVGALKRALLVNYLQLKQEDGMSEMSQIKDLESKVSSDSHPHSVPMSPIFESR